jgi:hypothetical protein
MKILTAYTDKFNQIVDLTIPRLKDYCDIHKFKSSCMKLCEIEERPHSWYKIKAFLNNIDNNDFLLWIDYPDMVLLIIELLSLSIFLYYNFSISRF